MVVPSLLGVGWDGVGERDGQKKEGKKVRRRKKGEEVGRRPRARAPSSPLSPPSVFFSLPSLALSSHPVMSSCATAARAIMTAVGFWICISRSRTLPSLVSLMPTSERRGAGRGEERGGG